MIVFWAVMGMISKKKKVIKLFIGGKCVPASIQIPLYSSHTELFVGRTGILAFKKGSRAAQNPVRGRKFPTTDLQGVVQPGK